MPSGVVVTEYASALEKYWVKEKCKRDAGIPVRTLMKKRVSPNAGYPYYKLDGEKITAFDCPYQLPQIGRASCRERV